MIIETLELNDKKNISRRTCTTLYNSTKLSQSLVLTAIRVSVINNKEAKSSPNMICIGYS